MTKSWLVAMSVPRMQLKPTDAVREKATVPAGWRTAAELARPRGLIFSFVSCTTLTEPSRSCQTSASVSHGIVHSAGSQYASTDRLGVCPVPRRATLRICTRFIR